MKNIPLLLSGMQKELDWHCSQFQATPVATVYFGGGTPSVVDPQYLGQWVNQLEKCMGWAGNPEMTIEVNPDDVTLSRIQEWKAMGINRFSMGVQSFDDHVLQWMNRAHGAQQADTAIKRLQDAGLDNITLDIIYGHGMNKQMSWEEDFAQFLRYQTPHLSAYALTIEERTALAHFTDQALYQPMDDEQIVHQFLFLHDQLTAAGMEHYELSNYAQPGKYSRHNSSYWKGIPFWGIGPSAHGYDGMEKRKMNISNNTLYSKNWQENQGKGAFEWETLSPVQMANEYWMTGLRTSQGVNVIEWQKKFGLSLPADFDAIVEKWKSIHYLCFQENTLSCTPRGWMVMDAILSDLFLTETSI